MSSNGDFNSNGYSNGNDFGQGESRFVWMFKIFGLAAAAILILAIFGFFFLKSKINTPLSKTSSERAFTVASGENAEKVSNDLYNKGLISSPVVFDAYLIFSGERRHIQAGTYALSPSMTMKQIAGVLANGKIASETDVVQIIEGWSSDDIGNYLQKNDIASKQDFDAAESSIAGNIEIFGQHPANGSLEGYLFPDTYFVKKNSSADVIINKMLDNFEAKVTPQMLADISAQHKNLNDILTMASIVEKEVRLPQDKKIVAGIFYNRLAIGMPLQSDATISYITKKHDVSSSAADLAIDSPYNTYMYKGLPPGPICNPSLDSIMAAIYPTKTDYLYFITKPDGTPVYAKTLQQQQQNEREYLK